MIRRVARWYLVTLGVMISVGTIQTLPWLVPATRFTAIQEAVAVVSGILLISGGVAGIMRLPGRVPAAYLGIGAGLTALGQIAGVLSGVSAFMPLVIGVYIALALLVIASWSLWPSNG